MIFPQKENGAEEKMHHSIKLSHMAQLLPQCCKRQDSPFNLSVRQRQVNQPLLEPFDLWTFKVTLTNAMVLFELFVRGYPLGASSFATLLLRSVLCHSQHGNPKP